MTSKLDLEKANDSTWIYAPDFPEAGDAVETTLVPSVEQKTAIPSDATLVLIQSSPGQNVYVGQRLIADPAITLPGAAFSATTTELNPIIRKIKAGQEEIRVISDDSAFVTLRFFKS